MGNDKYCCSLNCHPQNVINFYNENVKVDLQRAVTIFCSMIGQSALVECKKKCRVSELIRFVVIIMCTSTYFCISSESQGPRITICLHTRKTILLQLNGKRDWKSMFSPSLKEIVIRIMVTNVNAWL